MVVLILWYALGKLPNGVKSFVKSFEIKMQFHENFETTLWIHSTFGRMTSIEEFSAVLK